MGWMDGGWEIMSFSAVPANDGVSKVSEVPK